MNYMDLISSSVTVAEILLFSLVLAEQCSVEGMFRVRSFLSTKINKKEKKNSKYSSMITYLESVLIVEERLFIAMIMNNSSHREKQFSHSHILVLSAFI